MTPEQAAPLWIHTGPGHYIGSLILVCAETKEAAETLIREQLDTSGLRDEPLNVSEKPYSKNSVLICEDGEY